MVDEVLYGLLLFLILAGACLVLIAPR